MNVKPPSIDYPIQEELLVIVSIMTILSFRLNDDMNYVNTEQCIGCYIFIVANG